MTMQTAVRLAIFSAIFVQLSACGGSATAVKQDPVVDTELSRLSPSQAPQAEPKVKREAAASFEEGVKAYKAGDSDRALDLFKEAIDVQADLSEAYFNAGLIYWEKGDQDEAMSWFDKATKKGNKVADGLAARGVEKLEQGNKMAAMDLFRQAVAIDPFNAPANLNLAQEARINGDAKRARKFVRTALKQNGKNPDAYAVLARIYFDSRRYELAKLVCQSGLELNDQAARLHNTLGLIYLREDDQRRAIRSFDKAIKSDGSFVAAKLNLGALALNYKDFKLAHSQFKQAVALEPKNVMALLSFGVAARSIGNLEEAESQYRKVLSLDPKHVGALYNLGVLEGDYKQNHEEALRLLSEVMRLESRDLMLRKKVANRIEVARIQIEAKKEMEAAKKAEDAQQQTQPSQPSQGGQ